MCEGNLCFSIVLVKLIRALRQASESFFFVVNINDKHVNKKINHVSISLSLNSCSLSACGRTYAYCGLPSGLDYICSARPQISSFYCPAEK